MREFLFFMFVFVVINLAMAGIIYMASLPNEGQQHDDQLDRIEKKLDTLIEIGEKWQ